MNNATKSITVKPYKVYRNNNIECGKLAEFATLEEAKTYCQEQVEGYDEVADNDNDYECHGNNFRFEVYEGEPVEEIDGEPTCKDPVYQTKQYYDF